jgi:hypothetical protein
MLKSYSFSDLTVQSKTEYESDFLDVLVQTEKRTFRCVEIGENSLKLQLNKFLSNSETQSSELFKKLQAASLQYTKLHFSPDDNPRINRGWIFEVILTDKILQMLMEYETQYLQDVEISHISDKQFSLMGERIHFFHKNELWVGLPLPSSQLNGSILPLVDFQLDFYSTSPWQLTCYQKIWYCVASAEAFINSWITVIVSPGQARLLTLNPLFKALYGGNFPKTTKLMAQSIERLGLKQWFRIWVEQKLEPTEVKFCYYVTLDNFYLWQHQNQWMPERHFHLSDEFMIRFYGSLPESDKVFIRELLEWDVNTEIETQKRIYALKVEAAQKALDGDRAKAIEYAFPIMEEMKKKDLLDLAKAFDIKVKSNATKPVILERLKSCDRLQELCEKALEMPADLQRDLHLVAQ